MAHIEFVIPLQPAALLEETDVYYVRETALANEIPTKLKAARSTFRDEGPEYILESFDLYFSVWHLGDTLSPDIISATFEDLHKVVEQLNKNLGFLLDDRESINDEQKAKYQNVLKMLLYIYTQIVLLMEQKIVATKQGLSKKRVKNQSFQFTINKKKILVMLNNIMQRDIGFFWDPPLLEESIIKTVTEVNYRFLENDLIKNDEETQDELFALLGTLLKDYNHGTSFTVRMVQMLQHYEHMVACLAHGIKLLVDHYNCKSLLHDLITEIAKLLTEEQTEAKGGKFCAAVLCEIANLMPDVMLPEVLNLEKYLASDPACLRASVLNVMTEVILKVLTKHDVSEEEEEHRIYLFDLLLDHIRDVSPYVRSKVIQNWARLYKENAIPAKMLNQTFELIMNRLTDKMAVVRKSAASCCITFLTCNLFGSTLSLKVAQAELAKHQKTLDEARGHFDQNKVIRIEKAEAEWENVIMPELKVVIGSELEKLDKKEESEVEDNSYGGMSYNDLVDIVHMYLTSGKYADALKLYHGASLYMDELDKFRETYSDEEPVTFYLMMLKIIYLDPNKLVQDIRKTMNLTEQDLEHLAVFGKTVDYYKDIVKFLEIIDETLTIMEHLLESSFIGDMQEAVNFFINAFRFEIDNADRGILAMLKVMQRSEAERKELVVGAFKTIYLSSDANNKREEHAQIIVTRLITLAKSIPCNNWKDLQSIIADWTESGTLDNNVIDMLWQYYTGKVSVSQDDMIAVAELLRMAALGRRSIIMRNMKLVATIAFATPDAVAMPFLGSVFELLAVAGRGRIDLHSKAPPTRIKFSDQMFGDLLNVLIGRFMEPIPFYNLAMSGGMEFVYRMCNKPEHIMDQFFDAVLLKLQTHEDGNEGLEPYMVTRLCQALGCVAIKELEFMDDTVHKELKRRNNVRDSRKEEKEEGTKTKKNGRKSTIPLGDLSMPGSTLDDSTMEGAQSDDLDAEFILNILEHLCCGDDLLGQMAFVIKSICEQPDCYDTLELQGPAVIALIRYMLISSQFCRDNIQLLFTLLERCKHPDVKVTILTHLSDLLSRFPNIVEPWTPRIYHRLKDPLTEIRSASFFSLSSLILRDMVRAHSHIPEMCTLILDEDKALASMAKAFLTRLSKKELNLYSLLPDVFTHLMEYERLTDENVQTVMKYLFDLVQNSKHLPSLVDRFCCKFQLTEDVRHHRMIAYCLTLMPYNEKSLQKLLQNFSSYKHSVQDAEVHSHFKTILRNAAKPQVGKKDLKPILTEIETNIRSTFELQEDGQAPAKKATVFKKPRAPSGRKKSKRNGSDEDEFEDEDETFKENTPDNIDSSVRKSSRKKRNTARNAIGSDSDSD